MLCVGLPLPQAKAEEGARALQAQNDGLRVEESSLKRRVAELQEQLVTSKVAPGCAHCQPALGMLTLKRSKAQPS
jgi:hypothetical protein